jgi:hypothetical protein
MCEDNFTKAIDEALTKEYLNSIPQVETHEFSKKFQRKMSKLIKHREKPYYKLTNTTRKRVACIVALSVILSTMTVMSVDALRGKFFNFFVTTFEKYSIVDYDAHNEEYPTSIEKVYSIGYDLSEYTIDCEYTDDTTHYIIYIDNDKVIQFFQSVKINYDRGYNTEGAEIEDITVGEWDGIYFKDMYDYSYIILDVGDYIITICANLPKEQVIDIVETVGYVE